MGSNVHIANATKVFYLFVVGGKQTKFIIHILHVCLCWVCKIGDVKALATRHTIEVTEVKCDQRDLQRDDENK